MEFTRKHLKTMVALHRRMEAYKEETGEDISENMTKGYEEFARAFFADSAIGGLRFTPTEGNDADFTYKKRNDLRPAVFTMLSKEDNKIYHTSLIFATTAEMVKKVCSMTPFPISRDAWDAMHEPDSIRDAVVLTSEDIDGEPYSFRSVEVYGEEINLLIKNVLSDANPYADEE